MTTSPVTVSHVGICVADLDRASRFYTEALGFEPAAAFEVGAEFGALMELQDVQVESRFLTRDGFAIELLHFRSPGSVGPAVRRPVNQLGLTHLCLRVDDVDGVADRIVAAGGTVLRHTRTTFEGDEPMDFVYCTDPDGTRLELMRSPLQL